jgi:hypothetical protein
MKTTSWILGIAVLALVAAPAFADTLDQRVARVEQQLAAQSAREVQSSVDAYLANDRADATLVGGPGQAGYDGGFWIRGGTFLLKTNLTLQARYEYFDWDDKESEPNPGGDLSGFSLPRATLKFSGDATCDVHYYLELEFGHEVSVWDNVREINPGALQGVPLEGLGSDDPLHEGWIEYEMAPAFVFRMGLLRTATTRQLMTAPELQQFVDISLASEVLGETMPGWMSRNRDYGFMVHGVFGCDGEWSYMATVTNGDGWGHRNVLDQGTSDNLAFSARVNWDIMGHPGYEEGALKQTECGWVVAVGAWTHYYADHAQHNPLIRSWDRFTWGLDAAVGYGGFSFTGAYNMWTWSDADIGPDIDGASWLAQLGFLFPGTAWEIAARYSAYTMEFDNGPTFGGTEFAGAVNYYIDGHADKVTLDVAFIMADDDANIMPGLVGVYPAYWSTGESDGMLVRLQWQLAL